MRPDLRLRKKLFLIVFLAGGLFCLRPDAFADWSTAKRLTWTSGYSYIPAIGTVLSNAVHVVWDDSMPGNREIFYKGSTDGGTTWSALERLTWTSGLSRAPAMAIDSANKIHVVWDDATPDNSEIYYKTGN